MRRRSRCCTTPNGEARIALFSPQAWRRRYAGDLDDDARLERAFEHFEARQRQFAAVLAGARCAGDVRALRPRSRSATCRSAPGRDRFARRIGKHRAQVRSYNSSCSNTR